jgi:D-proline reductase (dithiol) PrdB
MDKMRRIRNRAVARAITHFPSLSRVFINSHSPRDTSGIPWAPPRKPLGKSKVAVVTTAGVHHRDQTPFDMNDKDGDPSFRTIDTTRPVDSLMITHDYYDHTDADRDINIVFPIERLKELEAEGMIGRVSNVHISFMGHITGRHVDALVKKTSQEAARLLNVMGVDVVLLTPG